MKKRLLLWLSLAIPMLSSCIKDEPLNREADILDIKVEGDAFIDGSISEDNSKIELVFSADADLTKVVPILTLTPEATISPASGTPIDLSYAKEVVYTVTSQSGNVHKKYTVKVGEIAMKFGFEEWELSTGGWGYPYPMLSDTRWSSANAGVSLAKALGSIKELERYPTKDTTLCVHGKYAATLLTIKGARVVIRNIPIFAGNLFWVILKRMLQRH